jgi:hypothetical protein
MAPTDHPPLNLYRQQGFAVAIVVLVVLLAGVNWILSPEQALHWLGAMPVLPLLWFGLTLWYVWIWRPKQGSRPGDQLAIERYCLSTLRIMVVGVGTVQIAVLGLDIWFSFGDHRADLELGHRILGLAASAVFIGIGNALPKILTPLSMLPPHLAQRVTSARRFVGRTFVILGLATGIALLLLPFPFAKALWRWTIIGVVLTILGAIVWMNAGPVRREQ